MLGNLSEVLIKVPTIFINKTQRNIKNSLHKIPEENILDPFYQIKHIQKRGNSLSNIYFKEKDFWKKNSKLDINFNNNKRLYKYDFPREEIDLDKTQKEQNRIFLVNNNSNKIDNYNNNIRFYNFSPNIQIKTSNEKTQNFNIYKKILVNQKDNPNNLFDTDILLKTDDRSRLFLNTENNTLKRNTSTVINRYKNKNINITEENIIVNNSSENLNKEGKIKFPKILSFKSQESLFQDNIDKRLISLISVKPKIKEQYKSVNRNMVGQRDYYIYQKLGRLYSLNPFYESINKKEELFKIINNKKKKKW